MIVAVFLTFQTVLLSVPRVMRRPLHVRTTHVASRVSSQQLEFVYELLVSTKCRETVAQREVIESTTTSERRTGSSPRERGAS
jgi:hypothetical protein